MVATPSTVLRGIAGFALLLLALLTLPEIGKAQQGSSPLVTSSSLAAVPSVLPTSDTAGWGQTWQTAADHYGNFLAYDFENGALYEYPANGGPLQLLIAPGALGGGWANIALAVDPWNNVWVSTQWSGGVIRIPWNAATNSWNVSAKTSPALPTSTFPSGYCNAAAMAINDNGVVAMSCEYNAWLVEFTIDAQGKATNGATVISALTARGRAVAIDDANNIYVYEDGGVPGVVMVPAGAVNLADDKALQRVDPASYDGTSNTWSYLLPSSANIGGPGVDANGNLYVGYSSGDGYNGIYMVPNVHGATGPTVVNGALDPTQWVYVSPSAGWGQPSVSRAGDKVFTPYYASWQYSNGASNVTVNQNGLASIGSAELGSAAVGATSASSTSIFYTFSGRVVANSIDPSQQITPARWIIQEDGAATQDFAVATTGSCVAGTAYPYLTAGKPETDFCVVNVNLTPQKVGSLSAQLLMQESAGTDSKGNPLYTTVATTALHGIGLAAAASAQPSLEVPEGSGLKKPSQLALDAIGNVYVADAGLGGVLEFAPGSTSATAGIPVGAGLTAPTGVAVDGSGNLFVADSGNVLEFPYSGSALSATSITLASGLGSNLRLAIDGLGRLYVADPDHARVVELYNLGGAAGAMGVQTSYITAGLTAPTAVAVDSNNALYIADGTNLFERGAGAWNTVSTSLPAGVTGLAIDASGSVYATAAGGTTRIAAVGGTLSAGTTTQVATDVTAPAGVAVDAYGNVYIADGTALDIDLVSANSLLNFGAFTSTSQQASLNSSLLNYGNQPLTVSGFTSSNALDYSAADVSCESASIEQGGVCQVAVTLNPGAGEQGTLTGLITPASNAFNTTLAIDTTGVGAALATSTTTVTVGAGSEAVKTSVTVKVAPSSGAGIPSGQVTITFLDPAGATQTATGTLDSTGSFTATLSPVHGGSQTFTAKYQGDRTYGRSTGAVTATIAKSAVTMSYDPNPPSYLPYTLSTANGLLPYDGSADYWSYRWPVTVSATAGIPTGTVNFMEGTTSACPANVGPTQLQLPASGNVSFNTSCLPIPQSSNVSYFSVTMAHTVTPVYTGDDSYQGFTGNSEKFIAVITPAVLIAAQPASVTVTAGTPQSANLTISSPLGYGYAGKGSTSGNNYTFPISLVCAGLPAHSTCSFNYASPDAAVPSATDINCTGTATQNSSTLACPNVAATVTINTNVAVGTSSSSSQAASRRGPIVWGAMFGFGLLGIVFRRKAGVYGNYLLVLGLTIFMFGATACATNDLSPQAVLTTPKGTYQVTVYALQTGSQTVNTANGPVVLYGSQNPVSVPMTIQLTVQ